MCAEQKQSYPESVALKQRDRVLVCTTIYQHIYALFDFFILRYRKEDMQDKRQLGNCPRTFCSSRL